jgi:hypothetical protein
MTSPRRASDGRHPYLPRETASLDDLRRLEGDGRVIFLAFGDGVPKLRAIGVPGAWGPGSAENRRNYDRALRYRVSVSDLPALMDKSGTRFVLDSNGFPHPTFRREALADLRKEDNWRARAGIPTVRRSHRPRRA